MTHPSEPRPRNWPYSPEEKEALVRKIVAMRDAGDTYLDISVVLDLSQRTVQVWYKERKGQDGRDSDS